MYAVRIVSLLLLLAGIYLLKQHGDSPLLIAGVLCILTGTALSWISRKHPRE